MKRYVLGIAVLMLGGCVSAGGSQSIASLGGAGDDLSANGSGAHAATHTVAVRDSSGRESVGSGRERGIPTPEPAREPAIREASVPTPQPPLPAGRVGGDPAARGSRGSW